MNQRPNILFFFTDDQRFDAVGAAGNDEIKTPHLDKLIQRGTTFTHAHIPGGTSGAVCMPSRAMLHTGKSLFHLEKNGATIPQNHTMMGELFRSAGYTTFGTGKWHNGRDAFARSFTAGDQIFFGGMTDHWNVPAYRFDPAGVYAKTPYIEKPMNSNKVEYQNFQQIEAGVHSTDLFTDASLQFLKDHDTSNPFFMYISLLAPHDPRSMPEEFLNMYDPEDIKLPENFLTEHPIDTGALKIRDEQLAAFPRDPDEIKRHIAEYYAMISHLDDAFGRLMDGLEKTGQLENTIVVFAGDNGLAVGQHGLMGKQNLYDHSVRVPLVFAGPGIPEGTATDNLAYLLDVFPTLCDLTGLDIPESVEGKSLKPCLEEADPAVRKSLWLAYEYSIRGVTDGSHKLIEYIGGETQLFDLQKDPWEMTNLAEDPSSDDTLRTLREELLCHTRENDDELTEFGQAFWTKRGDLKA